MTFREFCAETRSGNRTSARIEGRELLGTSFAAGGSFIADKIETTVDALREDSLVARLQPTVTTQEEGNAVAPIVTGGATAYWLEEGETCPASDLSTGKANLPPRRVAARAIVSKQLLMQSPVFEGVVKADLRRAVAEALDSAILAGSGSAGEPLGLLVDPDIPSPVTFGGAAQLPDIEEFSQAVRNAKVSGPLTWCVSPATASKWRMIPAFNSGDGTSSLWSAAKEIGVPHETVHAAEHLVILGRWKDLWIHEYGLFIESDPFTHATSGKVEINANFYVNFAPLRAASFCRSTDAGNQ